MKILHRYLTLTVIAGVLALAASAWAGECCPKTAAATKDGKACAACATTECCKNAAAAVTKAGSAKPCATCATKSVTPRP